MSVSYRIDYEVKIQGTREDFQRVPEVLSKLRPDDLELEVDWWWAGGEKHHEWMQSTLDEMIRCVEDCLKKSGDKLLLVDNSSDDDVTHGMYEAVLMAMDAHIPQLEFEIDAVCIDTEYGGDDVDNYYYSPSGEHALHLTGLAFFF